MKVHTKPALGVEPQETSNEDHSQETPSTPSHGALTDDDADQEGPLDSTDCRRSPEVNKCKREFVDSLFIKYTI